MKDEKKEKVSLRRNKDKYSPRSSPSRRKKFFNKEEVKIVQKKYKPDYIFSLLKKETPQRTKAEIRILAEYLSEKYEYFKKFKSTTDNSKLEKICNVLHLEEFKPNSTIIKFGEEGDKFYILLEGRIMLFKPSYPQKKMNLQEYLLYLEDVRDYERNEDKIRRILDKNSHLGLDMKFLMSIPANTVTRCFRLEVFVEEDEKLGEFEDGFAFGEIALIKKTTRNATIKSKNYCKLATINKSDYNKVMRELEEKRLEKVLKQFKKDYPLFEYWSLNHLIKLMNCFSNLYIYPGEYLFKQNEISDAIYIVKSGKFEIYSYVSFGWINEFYDYIIEAKSNIIYYLLGKMPVKEKEINDILRESRNKLQLSPMQSDPYNRNKIIISIPVKGTFEKLQLEKLDSVDPTNVFKIKIRTTEGPEVLGFVDALEMKNRYCFVRCVENAFIQKVKLIDFFKLVNSNVEESNKKWIMDIVAKKKRQFYIQLKKGVIKKMNKQEEYFDQEFDDFLDRKGKFKEDINNLNKKNINTNDIHEKNNSDNIIKNDNLNEKKGLSIDIEKKKIDEEHILNVKKLREIITENNINKTSSYFKFKKKLKTILPLLKDNSSIKTFRSTNYIEPLSSNEKSDINDNNNITEYNVNKKSSYSISHFVSSKENNKCIDKSSQVNEEKFISLNNNFETNQFNGNSQCINLKNNKPINLKENSFNSHLKSIRNKFKTITNKENEMRSFDKLKYKKHIDSDSNYLHTQIYKLTGMKRIIPKKEINYNVYDDNDINIMQIQSQSNRLRTNNKTRNKINLFLTYNTDRGNSDSKRYPKTLTEIDLKDFRNLRRKHRNKILKI